MAAKEEQEENTEKDYEAEDPVLLLEPRQTALGAYRPNSTSAYLLLVCSATS